MLPPDIEMEGVQHVPEEGNMASRELSPSTEKATPKSAAPDLSVAELEGLARAATAGPWRVVETRHPHYHGGAHTERRVFTTWDHPQLKGPLGVVNTSWGIGEKKDDPARHMSGLSPADAAYIAALSPDVLLRLIERLRCLEGLVCDAALGNTPASTIASSRSLPEGELGPGRTQ